MYLPFALYAGLMVKLRPTLLPYFAIVHALMDFSVLSVYLTLDGNPVHLTRFKTLPTMDTFPLSKGYDEAVIRYLLMARIQTR